jgi:hypothetical protein
MDAVAKLEPVSRAQAAAAVVTEARPARLVRWRGSGRTSRAGSSGCRDWDGKPYEAMVQTLGWRFVRGGGGCSGPNLTIPTCFVEETKLNQFFIMLIPFTPEPNETTARTKP